MSDVETVADPGLLIALITALTALAGYGLARRGTKEQNQQSAAASALAALEARADRAERGETRERERAERAETRMRECDDKIDELQDEARRLLFEQTGRCLAVTDNLTATIVTLRDVVVSEVAKAAADTAVDDMPPHPHTPPTS